MIDGHTLRFVHITDTHIGPDAHYNSNSAPHSTHIGAQALVRELQQLPFTPDFVLHTGDVAYDPDPAAYHAARPILSAIPYPVYYLAGNHDSAALLQSELLGVTPRDPFDTVVDLGAYRLICLDSTAAPAEPPRGRLRESQLEWLTAQCAGDRALIVAVHHNPLRVGIPWWDDLMSLENGDALHAALLPFRDRLRGVFFGHVHQDTDLYRDGILYASALSSWYQLAASPGQVNSERDRHAGPGYSVVTMTPDTTFIRRHRFVIE